MVRKLRQELNMKDAKLLITKSVSENRVKYNRNVCALAIPKRFASSEAIYFPKNGECTLQIDRSKFFQPRKAPLACSSLDCSSDANKSNFISKTLFAQLDSQTKPNLSFQESDLRREYAESTSNLENSKKQNSSFLSITSSGSLKNDLVVKSRSENQNESKALQVLGVVFIVFIITWLPFCFLNMLSTIIEMNNQITIQFSNLVVFFTYLGYFQSTLNPIIYTIFNQKFRKNFIEIIKCQRKMHLKRNNAYFKSYRSKLKKRNSSLLIKRV